MLPLNSRRFVPAAKSNPFSRAAFQKIEGPELERTVVPLYFFNVNGAVHSSEENGEEFPDDEAAWKEATLVAGEMFRDIPDKF